MKNIHPRWNIGSAGEVKKCTVLERAHLGSLVPPIPSAEPSPSSGISRNCVSTSNGMLVKKG